MKEKNRYYEKNHSGERNILVLLLLLIFGNMNLISNKYVQQVQLSQHLQGRTGSKMKNWTTF